MNSTLEGSRASASPRAIAAALRSFWRRTYSLNDATSSSLVMTSGAFHSPVPVIAATIGLGVICSLLPQVLVPLPGP